MSVLEIIQTILGATGALAVVVWILQLVKIKPLEINIFGWIGQSFMSSTNKRIDEINASVEELKGDIEDIRDQQKQDDLYRHRYRATQSRRNILNFNSEVVRDIAHTEEQYNQILEDIDEYERYCTIDPDYENTKAVASIQNIKRAYQKRLQKNDFLI